jgi:hypothetical protein
MRSMPGTASAWAGDVAWGRAKEAQRAGANAFSCLAGALVFTNLGMHPFLA